VKWTYQRGYLLAFLALLGCECAIACLLHDRLIRPYGGDTLAVVLVFTLIKACSTLRTSHATLAALVLAFAVEAAQYFEAVARLGLGEHAFARTVIGTSFDWGDIAAYCLGAASILLASRLSHSRATGLIVPSSRSLKRE
jgi:hypothetical protein